MLFIESLCIVNDWLNEPKTKTRKLESVFVFIHYVCAQYTFYQQIRNWDRKANKFSLFGDYSKWDVFIVYFLLLSNSGKVVVSENGELLVSLLTRLILSAKKSAMLFCQRRQNGGRG